MIAPAALFDVLTASGLSFYAGVPDSLLKDFCAYVTDNLPDRQHVIAANEGAATAMAVGHYLATGRPGVVYMQNSGLGNAVNPLLSIADQEVYNIPMLLLIGWRGEPGQKDEPQHVKQGKVTIPLLETLGIPHAVIDRSTSDIRRVVGQLSDRMMEQHIPVALVVRAGTFDRYALKRNRVTSYELNREAAISLILDQLGDDDVVVSTTGMTSREIFEYREARAQGHGRDFLTVGAMGHSSQIALGIAIAKPERQVYCIDGDGAVIMHMGSLAIIGTEAPRNFRHIVINNGAHDSVGGQPTAGFAVNIGAIATACGYREVAYAESSEQIGPAFGRLKLADGPALLEIRVNKGARENLGRPTTTPVQNKIEFMKFLEK